MAKLPAQDCLRIEVWDWDLFHTDEMIGACTIDLSDRLFSSKWMKLPEKPIEERSLYNMTSKVEQGKLRSFVEIFPKSDNKKIPERVLVEEQPQESFELRVLVWTTEDIPMMDVEGTSDI